VFRDGAVVVMISPGSEVTLTPSEQTFRRDRETSLALGRLGHDHYGLARRDNLLLARHDGTIPQSHTRSHHP
jgi:hypothetical protein